MRSIHRTTTLRTAAAVAGAATVLALPVGSAFADSRAVPEPEVLPGIEQRSVEPSVQPSVERSVQPSVEPCVEPRTQPPVVPPVQPLAEPPADRKGVRTFVTAVRLADGSVAKVHKVGRSHFEADILTGSTKLDTLVSRGAAASYGQSNGLHVVLRPNGTVTSWMDGAPKPVPKAKPVPQAGKHVRVESSVRVGMPDGRIAKLVDGPRGKYAVISTPNGHVLGSADLQRPALQNDGWTYGLVRDGKRVKFVVIDGKGGGNSWVYDFGGRLIERYTVDAPKPAQGHARVVASSGGAASAGAAGLGFAVLPARG
ncbi:hypothetical protein ACFVJ8_09115 [Streptomyces yangpuensis]|uniref:hypothetical protein n=1 Tax=Streptomyces yangpuensis TaxID=1648182 RepID=UPI00363DD0E4